MAMSMSMSLSPCEKGLLASCKTLRHVKQIHAQILRSKMDNSNLLLLKLVLCCCTLPSPSALDYALSLFSHPFLQPSILSRPHTALSIGSASPHCSSPSLNFLPSVSAWRFTASLPSSASSTLTHLFRLP